MRDYPQFSFWISITVVKICFSRSKPGKNTFELVGTVFNRGSTVAEVLFMLIIKHEQECSYMSNQWSHLQNVYFTVKRTCKQIVQATFQEYFLDGESYFTTVTTIIHYNV